MAQPSRLDVAVPVQDDGPDARFPDNTPGRAEIDKELLRAIATTEKAEKAERADAEEKPKIPTFLDLMSGPNYPLGRALSWCGWEGRSCDIVASCEHDLRKEKLHTELMEEVVSTDLMFIGPDCQTLSGMREKAIFGHPSPPKPLRNSSYVMEWPESEIRKNNAERVGITNRLARFVRMLIKQIVACGNGFGLENP